MVETGNYAAHQLEGLLEDLEVDIESPSRLDLHLETSQKDLEVGSSTFEGVENLLVPINFEHDAVGQTKIKIKLFHQWTVIVTLVRFLCCHLPKKLLLLQIS
jgi:hypothetical protein